MSRDLPQGQAGFPPFCKGFHETSRRRAGHAQACICLLPFCFSQKSPTRTFVSKLHRRHRSSTASNRANLHLPGSGFGTSPSDRIPDTTWICCCSACSMLARCSRPCSSTTSISGRPRGSLSAAPRSPCRSKAQVIAWSESGLEAFDSNLTTVDYSIVLL